jgi:hypothetical protein
MLRDLFAQTLHGVLVNSSATRGTSSHFSTPGADSDTSITVKFYDGIGLTNELIDYASHNLTKLQSADEDYKQHRAKDNPEDQVDDFLGWYEPIRSPGAIGFNCDRLLSFGLSLCASLENHYKTRLDSAEFLLVICMTILKTLIHEYFHYFMDIMRNVYRAKHTYSTFEEGLAVAFSRIYLLGKRYAIDAPDAGNPADLWNSTAQWSSAGRGFRLRVISAEKNPTECSLKKLQQIPCSICSSRHKTKHLFENLFNPFDCIPHYSDYRRYPMIDDVISEISDIWLNAGSLRFPPQGVDIPLIIDSQMSSMFFQQCELKFK